MSKIETNTIDNISGSSTLTIGDSNTSTITLKSGATLTNFPDNTPAFEARSSAFQSIANTTHTQIAFGTEIIDTASAFASNVFTVPSGEGGKYFLFAQAGQQGWSTNRFLIILRKNGSDGLGTGELVTSVAQYPTTSASALAVLAAGDTVDVTIYQDSGSSQNISTGDRTIFFGYKIIE